MFILNQTATYKWPVTVMIATDGGRFNEATFDATFSRLAQEDVDQIRATIGTPDYSPAKIARRVMVGWSGVQDANGDMPFSDDALKSLLSVPGAASAITLAFLESASGIVRKN